MRSKWMSASFWYKTCRNRLINNRVLIVCIKTVEMKNCKCYHSSIPRSARLSLALYSWMASFAIFQNEPVFIQMIRSLLFNNRFLQIRYFAWLFLICLIWNISVKIGLLEVSTYFFALCILKQIHWNYTDVSPRFAVKRSGKTSFNK